MAGSYAPVLGSNYTPFMEARVDKKIQPSKYWGCVFSLLIVASGYRACVCAKSLQLCPTLCDPMDSSLPCSFVHGILWVRALEWIAMPSSRASSQPRDQTHASCSSYITGGFHCWATREGHRWLQSCRQKHEQPLFGASLHYCRPFCNWSDFRGSKSSALPPLFTCFLFFLFGELDIKGIKTKKGNNKDCSNYVTVALISHVSKIMLKILQTRLQQYENWELPDVQAGFRKDRGTRDQIANIY